jgi:hypothetical protein
MIETESIRQEGRWLLLIHQIPARPAYFRVKVARRLRAIGAVALKSSVYVLPHTPEAREDFQWLLREILGEGGEATLCAASLLEGATDAEIEDTFRRERDADYEEVVEMAKSMGEDASRAEVERLRKRLDEVARLDFFEAPGRAIAEHAVAALERPVERAEATRAVRPAGATWVTRRGIKVDRMSSAWLIRRFIDADLSFKFVAPEGYRPDLGELRFDMFEGEFTHEGDRCTFETLVHRFGLDDPALAAVAEVVHDIDCKEDRYGRPETAGVAALVQGIALAHADDEARLAAGVTLFESLYAHFHARAG